MNDNSNQQSNPQIVRVDLTSQDLRTGTIRLPRQLHGHFSEGELAAEDLQDSDIHLLTVVPPRDLQGLTEFMEKHDLQTNDAVVMHVDGQELKLEPFYRRPQAQPQDDEPQSEAGDVCHERLFEEHQSEEQQSEDGPAMNSQSQTEPSEPQRQPIGQQAESGPAAAEYTTPAATVPAEPDPFDRFADYDDYESYGDDAGFQSGDDDPAQDTQVNMEPDPEPLAASEPNVGPASPHETQRETEQLEPDPFHTTARRPFTLPTGPLAVRRPASFAQQFAERKETQKTEVPQSRPTPEVAAPEPIAPKPSDSHSLVENYLNTPGLPSILNAADLAGRLNLDKDELIEIMGKLAAQPNSRLSTVRPGFYLLKRPDNG